GHHDRAHRRPAPLRPIRVREEGSMKATQRLHDAGQSIWLDNITRAMLASGTLERYVRELSVTGLTSNPTIFDHAIKNSHDYDAAIRATTAAGKAGEELFFELALDDLRQAADLFRPVHEATNRVDGWVSLELSPTLAYDTPGSVAAALVSRWDAAVAGKVPPALHDQLGIAMAKRTYKAYRDLLASDRWLRLLNVGARSQRLLWASTGTKDPKASDVLYVKSLAAPHSVNTMPEKTLLALADHGEIGAMLPHGGGDAEDILDRFAKAGVDANALAAELQRDGAAAFVASWKELLACLVDKSQTLKKAG